MMEVVTMEIDILILFQGVYVSSHLLSRNGMHATFAYIFFDNPTFVVRNIHIVRDAAFLASVEIPGFSLL